MKNLVLVFVVLFAFIANSADWIKSGFIKKDNVNRYMFVGIPEGDSMQIGVDTMTAMIGAAGTNVKWVDLGPCPTDPADSGNIGICVADSDGGTVVGLACSLFVTLNPSKGSSAPRFLKNIASGLTSNTGTIITDSLNSKNANTYALPTLKGKMGYRLLAKFYTYSASAVNEAKILKSVFLTREKP
jgi:hypothetical protein